MIQTFEQQRRTAVEQLIASNILYDPRVIRAILRVPREAFVPTPLRPYSYIDAALPIGWGQTTSAFRMAPLLSQTSGMTLGDKVLEVGTGSGYMACVYAEVVASAEDGRERWGHIWTLEIIRELANIATINVGKLGFGDRVTVLNRDASGGFPEHAPYERIIVAAAGPRIPDNLIDQLSPGGTLLMPVGNAYQQQMVKVSKDSEGKLNREDLGGAWFVPFTGKSGWR